MAEFQSSKIETQDYTAKIDPNRKNAMVPPVPKGNEIIICQVCGKPMLPKDFSKDEKTRKREFKWHIHQACIKQMEDLVDRSTPGLLSERKKAKNGH